MEGDAVAPFLSPGFFHILVFVFWRFVAVSGYYILTSVLRSPVLFFSFCLLSVTLPIILSLSVSFSISAAFHHPSPVSTNIHPPTPPPSLSLFLPIFLTVSTSFFVALCLFFSHPFSPSLSYDSHFLTFTTWLSPFSFLLSPLHPTTLLLRPHSHVDLFGGGPRGDRRGGGCYRLHPALPPHRPRQIPHQTQRSTAHTHTDPCKTYEHTRTHSCMHAWAFTEIHLHKYGYMRTRISHGQTCICIQMQGHTNALIP